MCSPVLQQQLINTRTELADAKKRIALLEAKLALSETTHRETKGRLSTTVGGTIIRWVNVIMSSDEISKKRNFSGKLVIGRNDVFFEILFLESMWFPAKFLHFFEISHRENMWFDEISEIFWDFVSGRFVSDEISGKSWCINDVCGQTKFQKYFMLTHLGIIWFPVGRNFKILTYKNKIYEYFAKIHLTLYICHTLYLFLFRCARIDLDPKECF